MIQFVEINIIEFFFSKKKRVLFTANISSLKNYFPTG